MSATTLHSWEVSEEVRAMMRTFTRTAVMVGLLAAAGGVGGTGILQADPRPPQVIQSGFG